MTEKEDKIKYLIGTLIASLGPRRCYDILHKLEWIDEWQTKYVNIPACEFLHRKLTDEIMKVVNE